MQPKEPKGSRRRRVRVEGVGGLSRGFHSICQLRKIHTALTGGTFFSGTSVSDIPRLSVTFQQALWEIGVNKNFTGLQLSHSF